MMQKLPCCHDHDIPPHPVHPQSCLHAALFTLNLPHPNLIHIQTLSPPVLVFACTLQHLRHLCKRTQRDATPFHQQPCKFSNGLKKIWWSEIRHFHTFSEVLRHSQTSSWSVIQNYLFWYQSSSYPDIFRLTVFQTPRLSEICQFFSAHQFCIYSDSQKMSVIFSSAVRWSETC